MWKRASAVLATVAATLLVAGVVQASPPDPNEGATKPVREQNLDGNGWIAVHEQGTAKVDIQNSDLNVTLQNEELDVNVTNPSLPVSGTIDVGNLPSNQEVTVTNFPDTQNVTVTGGAMMPPAVTKVRHLVFLIEAGGGEIHTFPTMNVTSISIQDVDDEISLHLKTPLSGEEIFGHVDLDGDDEQFVQNFNYPIPVNGIHAVCANESENCSIFVDMAGF